MKTFVVLALGSFAAAALYILSMGPANALVCTGAPVNFRYYEPVFALRENFHVFDKFMEWYIGLWM